MERVESMYTLAEFFSFSMKKKKEKHTQSWISLSGDE